MNFRVYETDTNEDVTDKCEWFIDSNGKLLCMTDYSPVYVWENRYYYKIEMTIR